MTSPLVHSPYNAEYDLVPYQSEEAGAPAIKPSEQRTPPPSSEVSATDGEHDPLLQHQYLSGQCEYLEISGDATLDPVMTTSRLFKLFVGHVKYEVTVNQLRWIIYMLTGVTCGKIETRGLGCFMVFFSNYEEMWKVKGLHKRALFDHHGVWFARNQLQEEILHRYVSVYLNGINHSHLPNGLLVVDEETSRRRKSKGAKKPKEEYDNRAPMLAPGYVPTPPVALWWGAGLRVM